MAGAIYKAAKRLSKREISVWLFLLWLGVWSVAAVVVIFPELLSWVAFKLGVGRGVDLVLYLSLFIIVYTLFKMNIRLGKIEKDITRVVSRHAIENARQTDEVMKKES